MLNENQIKYLKYWKPMFVDNVNYPEFILEEMDRLWYDFNKEELEELNNAQTIIQIYKEILK
jgi:hypothetical protein